MTLVPAMPDWFSGQKLTSALLQQVTTAVRYLQNPPEAIIYNSGTQSIPNSAYTALTFDTNLVDTVGGHSTTINPSRYTFVYPGTYLCVGTYASAPNAAGGRNLQWAKNGTVLTYAEADYDVNQANFHIIQVTMKITGLVGDYVELQADQNSGGALATIAGECSMQITWQHA